MIGKTTICKTCGNEIPRVSKRCPKCGAKIYNVKMVICKSCGEEIAKTANRCPKCGAVQHIIALSIAGVLSAFIIYLIVKIIIMSLGI